MSRTRIKICCIGSLEEARLAVGAGADALGLVSAMPSGPGVISDTTIAEIAAVVPPPVASVLLTSRTDASAIAAQQRATGASVLQLVDAVSPAAHRQLEADLPGIRRFQVIHVRSRADIDDALAIAPYVKGLLLDSGNPTASTPTLGGTGRVHDWTLSREIVERSSVPVFLAGGLNVGNVAEAIRTVRPFGVDVCSGVRTDRQLDADKLAAFVEAVASS
ncbi:MAG: N-(5'-phosphoribosyl)anthranilate isomerase [Rubricoccaceae bacterium]